MQTAKRIHSGVVHVIQMLVKTLVLSCIVASSCAYAQKKIIYIGSSEVSALEPRRLRIVSELGRLGHVVDRDFTIVSRTYNNDTKQLTALAATIVGEKPDLIYAAAWDAANALKPLTKTIPIVFAARANLESPTFRLVENLQVPESNLTGFTRYVNLIPKKLQVLKDAFPATRRVGFIHGVEIREERRREYAEAANKIGIGLSWRRYEKSDLPNLAGRLNDLPDDAFMVAFDDFLVYNRVEYLAQLAKVKRPVICPEETTDKGVLMHYVPVLDGEAKAAEYISKLLRGAKVRDLAVQEPQEFDFSVNVTTLRRNGLTMSRDVLARARKVE
jgi:putative tryptophan/tyrosine transport system substrate-binding protein